MTGMTDNLHKVLNISFKLLALVMYMLLLVIKHKGLISKIVKLSVTYILKLNLLYVWYCLMPKRVLFYIFKYL